MRNLSGYPPQRGLFRSELTNLGDQYRDRQPGYREADEREHVGQADAQAREWWPEEEHSRHDAEYECGHGWPHTARDCERSDEYERDDQEAALDEGDVQGHCSQREQHGTGQSNEPDGGPERTRPLPQRRAGQISQPAHISRLTDCDHQAR